MKTISFNKITHPNDIPQEIKELYIAAFPETERRPWSDIEFRINTKDPIFNFYVLQHNSNKIGFLTSWHLPSALYIEHFAVLPAMRGAGFGAAAIKELTATNSQPGSISAERPLILEVELPDASPEAARRIEFYKHAGLLAMDQYPYYQPPYQRGLPDIPMMLMVSHPLTDPDSMVRILHTIVYNQ